MYYCTVLHYTTTPLLVLLSLRLCMETHPSTISCSTSLKFHHELFWHTQKHLFDHTKNFRLKNAISLKIGHKHRLIGGETFRLLCLLRTELWSPKFKELDTPFRKSSHIKFCFNTIQFFDQRRYCG